MTIFRSFFGQNFSKIFSKTHQITLKNFPGGACPRTPLANAWLRFPEKF